MKKVVISREKGLLVEGTFITMSIYCCTIIIVANVIFAAIEEGPLKQ